MVRSKNKRSERSGKDLFEQYEEDRSRSQWIYKCVLRFILPTETWKFAIMFPDHAKGIKEVLETKPQDLKSNLDDALSYSHLLSLSLEFRAFERFLRGLLIDVLSDQRGRVGWGARSLSLREVLEWSVSSISVKEILDQKRISGVRRVLIRKAKEAIIRSDVKSIISSVEDYSKREKLGLKNDFSRVDRARKLRNIFFHRDGILEKGDLKELGLKRMPPHRRYRITMDEYFEISHSLWAVAHSLNGLRPTLRRQILREALKIIIEKYKNSNASEDA